jgi:hypothetical protein
MPSDRELPEDLKSLAFRNALRVDSGADFHHHIDRLCSSLQSTPSSSTFTVSCSPQPVTSTTSPPSIDRVARLKNLRKTLLGASCILTLIFFFFIGFTVGDLIASPAKTWGAPWPLGAVPTWLFGIWLTYFLWRRFR